MKTCFLLVSLLFAHFVVGKVTKHEETKKTANPVVRSEKKETLFKGTPKVAEVKF